MELKFLQRSVRYKRTPEKKEPQSTTNTDSSSQKLRPLSLSNFFLLMTISLLPNLFCFILQIIQMHKYFTFVGLNDDDQNSDMSISPIGPSPQKSFTHKRPGSVVARKSKPTSTVVKIIYISSMFFINSRQCCYNFKWNFKHFYRVVIQPLLIWPLGQQCMILKWPWIWRKKNPRLFNIHKV